MYLCFSVHHIAHLTVYNPSDEEEALHGGAHLCFVVSSNVQCWVACIGGHWTAVSRMLGEGDSKYNTDGLDGLGSE